MEDWGGDRLGGLEESRVQGRVREVLGGLRGMLKS